MLFEEYEARIRDNLTSDQFQIDQINDLFGYFSRLLNAILASGDNRDPQRYWAIDDLYCAEVRTEAGNLFTSGSVYWLEGGERYEFFHAVIELTEQALNYVFTFTAKTNASAPELVIQRNEEGIRVETGSW